MSKKKRSFKVGKNELSKFIRMRKTVMRKEKQKKQYGIESGD